jgi:hypothetical protein
MLPVMFCFWVLWFVEILFKTLGKSFTSCVGLPVRKNMSSGFLIKNNLCYKLHTPDVVFILVNFLNQRQLPAHMRALWFFFLPVFDKIVKIVVFFISYVSIDLIVFGISRFLPILEPIFCIFSAKEWMFCCFFVGFYDLP